MTGTPGIPLGSYDFAAVVTTFGGVVLLGGVSVKVSRDAEAATDEVGGNGDVVVSVNNDRRGKIEIEFMPSSPSLDYLTQQQLAFGNTRIALPVSVADLTGRSLHGSPQAWVIKIPDAEYAAASGNRTVTIRVANLNTLVRGSV